MKAYFIVLALSFLILALCLNLSSANTSKELTRKVKSKFPLYGLLYGFGFNALAVLYWIKVKIVVVAFFIGTALVLWFRYFGNSKPYFNNDVILPYNSGLLGYEHFEHDPYISYSHYSEPIGSDNINSDHKPWSSRKAKEINQFGDIIFHYLGVGSEACRKRFLCELKFHSRINPVTSLSYDMIHQSFFPKYYEHEQTTKTVASSFRDCANVYKDCTVIEEDIQ